MATMVIGHPWPVIVPYPQVMPVRGRYAWHLEQLCDVLSAIMDGRASADDFRSFLRRQIAKGIPIHPDAVAPDIPDEILLVEARYAVLAIPRMSRWHGDAREFIKEYCGGETSKNEGRVSWNLIAGGIDA